LVLFSGLILFISTFGYAFADLQSELDIALEQAMVQFEAGESKNALIYFDKVLEIDPENSQALYYKAITLHKLEQRQDASSIIEKLLGSDIAHVGAMGLKANDLQIKGEIGEALLIYEQILEINPDHSNAHSAIGDNLFEKGDGNGALNHYEKALHKEPTGKDATGVLYADKILKIDENHIDALNAKGTTLVQLNKSREGFTIIFADELDSAISYFDRVLEQDPKNTDALFNKGRSLVQLGLKETKDNSTETYQMGIKLVKDVLEIDPNNFGALLYLGDRLISEERPNEGLPYIERILEIDPNNEEAMFEKALAASELKDYQTAGTYYDKVLNVNPLHRLAAANFWYLTNYVIGYYPIEGFLDVKVVDTNGFLAGHLRVPQLKLLNHTIGHDFLDEWEVAGIEQRNGQDYQVLKYERSLDVKTPWINGGAEHFGISYKFERDLWKLYANYWEYYVDKGDTVTFSYTVFRLV